MVDLQNKPQEFVDLYALANPIPGARAKVPLLEVTDEEGSGDEKVLLAESLVIAEYIAEKYGSNILLPSSAKDRATMRLFTELCGSSFSHYIPILRAQNAEQAEAAIQALKDSLVNVDIFLKHYYSSSGPFLAGKQFSLAECNAAPFVFRVCTILPAFTGKEGATGNTVVDPMQICDELDLKHLKRWMQAVLERPSVVETSGSKEEMIASTSRLLERFAAMAATK